LIAKGRLSFFLGAAVHNTHLLGDQFYEELAARLGVAPPDRNRADVAEQLIDRVGRAPLSRAIEEIIAAHFNEPWLMHYLLASLARRPAANDVQRPLIVFTTNYDDVLEATLTAASVPFHLFLYQPDGPHVGRFLHRPPGGQLRAIINPDGVYKLEDQATVVVKLNGGLDPQRDGPGGFVVASRDFVELANRIPSVLPRVVRGYLRTRSLLFAGHGLFEPDVRAFARYARRQRGDSPSWAVQNRKRDAAYWRDSCGVDIREADLNTYILALHRALASEFGIDT
jgi:hypothetical protein